MIRLPAAPPATTPRQWWRLREGLLLLGFVLLVIAGVVSVVVPELGRDPEGTRVSEAAHDAAVPAK